MNPVNPILSELIRLTIRLNPVNPKETEFIRIDTDRPDSFGLKVRFDRIDWIHSD